MITPQEIKVLFEGERRQQSRLLHTVWTEAERVTRLQLLAEMEKARESTM